MTESEILLFINKIEYLYEVEKWTINGVHIWPLIRLELGEKLAGNVDCKNIKKRKVFFMRVKKMLVNLFNALNLYLLDYKNNVSYDNEEILCFVNNSERNINVIDKGLYDPIINPISDGLITNKKKCFFLEYVYGERSIRIPRYNKTKIINFGIIMNELRNYLKILRKNKVNMPQYDKFIKYCSQNDIEINFIEIQNIVNRLLAIKQYYLKILINTRVKLILISDWRNTMQMALVMAAKQLGIKCIEIHHGYYGQKYFTHFGWIKEPKEQYECRPNYYWCWTEKSALTLNGELKHGRAIYGGIPFVLAWNNNIKNRLGNIDIDLEKRIPLASKVVLVTLSNIVNKDKYPPWLIELVKETNGRYYWIFRKHIADNLSAQDEICREIEQYSNAEWHDSYQVPLFQVLELSDVHITYDSSTVIEAGAMGIGSIILAEYARYRFEEQISTGMVSYINSKEDIIKKINEYINVKNINCNVTHCSDGIDKLINLLDD